MSSGQANAAASGRHALHPSLTRRIYSRIRSYGRVIGKPFKKLPSAIGSISKRLWRGHVDEETKVVQRKSLGSAVLQCFIHLVPVSVTTTIAYFNLAGYFIGSNLQGLTGQLYQAIDVLSLQVTAKLLELFIVASLGIIIADLVRMQLFGKDGLPLGLLSAKQQFTEINYLLSPEFRFGLAGFARHRKRLFFGILILTSSLISIFAGPSAALLLIPTQRTDWPAGGASFWLVGDEDSLWPSTLTASSIGGAHCESPGNATVNNEILNYSGCIWAGYSSLAEAFKQRHLDDEIDLVVDDGVLKRNFVIRAKGEVAETWALAIHMAVGVFAKGVAQAWYQALIEIPPSNWYHTLRYRIRDQTKGSVTSWVPVVRTSCGVLTPISYDQSGHEFPYPDLPEYDVDLDLNYLLETNLSFSSAVQTQWIEVPEVIVLNNSSSTTDVPSAFLSVAIPQTGLNDSLTVFSCSIDARWAIGTYDGVPVGDLDADYLQSATIKNTRSTPDLPGYQYNFLPINDGSWRRVQISVGWLDNLTPRLSNNISDLTSLATLLTDAGLDNNTGLVINWVDVQAPLESIIATLVADGMSRQGYAANVGSLSHVSDAQSLLQWDNGVSSRSGILAGGYSFPRPTEGNATRLQWSVVVGGYAYRADSVAYYLALTVLFLHATLALGHAGYILWSRVCSDAWDSLISFVVLAAKSGLPRTHGSSSDPFENASAGIERYRTMRTVVRIRATASSSSSIATVGQEDIKILFGDEGLEPQYNALEVNKAYG